MIRAERIELNEGEKYNVEAHGNLPTILAELTNLCGSVRSEFLPFMSIDSFMDMIAYAIKNYKPDKIMRPDLSEEDEAEAVDCTGRMN